MAVHLPQGPRNVLGLWGWWRAAPPTPEGLWRKLDGYAADFSFPAVFGALKAVDGCALGYGDEQGYQPSPIPAMAGTGGGGYTCSGFPPPMGAVVPYQQCAGLSRYRGVGVEFSIFHYCFSCARIDPAHLS